MEILESHNIELLGHTDLNGKGDGMQIMQKGDIVYVGHMGYTGVGTSIVDVSNPRDPQVVRQIPIPENTHSHKVQLAGDILLVNHEQQLRGAEPYSAGLAVYDVSTPSDPKQIGFMPLKGQGVHRMWWTGDRYAYFSAREEGYIGRFLMTADMSDPENPRIASRWWYPGQWAAGGEKFERDDRPPPRAHHVIVKGNRAYGGYGDAGLVVFAVDDGNLELISQITWYDEIGGQPHTHTALPLLSHNVLLVTDEALKEYCQEAKKDVRVFDISNEQAPTLLSKFPVPQGDFCERGGRFGPHNLHENRPGTFISEDIVFLTYFNAGLRVYDVHDPANPREIAAFVPEAGAGQKAIQINDVYVNESGLIFVTDRLAGGLYILRLTDANA
jgi:hypothetical protein